MNSRPVIIGALIAVAASPAVAQVATGTAAAASIALPPVVTPEEIKQDPLRGSPGFGAAPRLNIRIEGDGIGLPPGVGPRNQTKSDGSPQQGKPSDGKDGVPISEKPKRERAPEPQDGPPQHSNVPPPATVPPATVTPAIPARGSDRVAERIERGFEREPGTARPTDIKLKEGGVSLPLCTTQSREGDACE